MTAVVQVKHNGVLNGTSVSVTLDSTPTAGNLLVGILTAHNTVVGPTYPWGLAAPLVSNGSGESTHVFAKIAGAGESTTVSFSATTARYFGLTVIEVSPTAGRSWLGLDKSALAAHAALVTSQAVGPTAAQEEADDFAVVGTATGAGLGTTSVAWTNSYTAVPPLSASSRGFAGYKVLGSAAATDTTGSWTSAVDAASLLATFKQVVPGAAGSRFLGLL